MNSKIAESADEQAAVESPAPLPGSATPSVVALGGAVSAIPALVSFFQCTRLNGFAYMVILHLAAAHESMLADLLRKHTSMTVVHAQESVEVRPDTVYVISPRHAWHMIDGQLQIGTRTDWPVRVAVDLFFRTLADALGPRATAIVLSGPDADGAIGIKRIKERGGLAIAQNPDEAQHEGMPRAAIATGAIDWVLPVSEMPGRIAGFVDMESGLRPSPERAEDVSPMASGPVSYGSPHEVLAFLRMRTGHDFSAYERTAVLRRIGRRMQINGVRRLDDYIDCLRTHHGEPDALLRDLLVSGSNFFRDADCFVALQRQIPFLFQGKPADGVIRVWVAACATGEEAYSIAMLLAEYMRRLDVRLPIQIFATDVDSEAIRVARDGIYPPTIAADVSEERLRQFFVKDPRGYRVRRELREQALFVVHDVLKDAPFSRIDLLSCRDFLICMNRDAQQRVLETAHFALLPEGRLLLGASDAAIDDSPLFSTLDKKHRVYAARPSQRLGPLAPGVVT